MARPDQAGDAGGSPPRRPGFATGRSLFLRGVAAVYAIAFASWWVQFPGLSGDHGVLPAPQLLEAAGEQLGEAGPRRLPGLFWWTGASDTAQAAACALGLGLSIAVVLGFLPGPGLAALWALYLTLVSFSGVFMGYQWEALLLEAGFLAPLWAPWKAWRLRRAPSLDPPPSLAVHWLVRALVFRLMFFSGVVKLASRDEVWWDLTALTVHYQTQPLPTWTAYWVHHLPDWFHVASCVAMFGVELVLSWLVFGPRPARTAAFAGTAGLMAAVAATGNYTYFNLLAAVLCLPLLDDAQWAWVGRGLRALAKRGRGEPSPPPTSVRPRPRWSWRTEAARLPFAVLLSLLTTTAVAGQTWGHVFRRPPPGLPWGEVLAGELAPFHLVNTYGLFANMTETRPELVVEGSADGVAWVPYEFRHKPGDLSRRPRFVAPHQPRLDWQMWFEALRAEAGAPPSGWFRRFLGRLAEGEPAVTRLLAENPFADGPPRFLRVRLYQYRFAPPGSEDWWERELVGDYVRPVGVR